MKPPETQPIKTPPIAPATTAVPVSMPSIPPQTEPTPQEPAPTSLDPKNIIPMIKGLSAKWKIMIGLVLLLVFLLVLVGFTSPGKRVVQKLILPTNSPIPTVTPIESISVPTQYANDPAVLDIQKKLDELNTKLGTTSLRDDTLRPPSLDWNVSFKSQ